MEQIVSTTVIIYFLFLFSLIASMIFKYLTYQSRKRTERHKLSIAKYTKESEILDNEIKNREMLDSYVKEAIISYERCVHFVPCRIIEKVNKYMDYPLKIASMEETNDKIIKKLIKTIVFNTLDKKIQEDTEEYDKKLRKELMENGNNNQEL